MRSTNGVMGSWSAGIRARMPASRIMKLVADVSSSMSRTDAPASMASTRFAAWEVDPLALVVVNDRVSVPEGRSMMNGEMSTPVTARPSSARTVTASDRVMTHSRPSPAIWG